MSTRQSPSHSHYLPLGSLGHHGQGSLPRGTWGSGERWLPTLCCPRAESRLPHDSLGTPGARRSLQARLSWWDSGRGPRWHWSRNAAGQSWHSPAAGCTWSSRAQVRPPGGSSPLPPCRGPPGTASAPARLTVSPVHTSRSRRRRPPRSPHRWHARHRQQPSPGPSGGRGEGPAPWGTSHGQGPEMLGKLRLKAVTGSMWGHRASPAEVTTTLGGEGLADKGAGDRRCSCWAEERKKAWGVRPGLWPYLVGCHQIKITGVCWVELHDMVHGLPIGHRHHPPAHHLHALIQVDLGWGGTAGCQGDSGAPRQGPWRGTCACGWGLDPGLGSQPHPLSGLPRWEIMDKRERAVGQTSTRVPLLGPHQELPP